MTPRETAVQPWLRWLAASLALTSGAVHLGQIGVHLAEGWSIAGFFVVVGVLQVAAALLLLRPWPPWVVWIGIGASAAVVAVWMLSRSAGLPFVADGRAEPIGLGDALASLTEAWTIAVLCTYLAEPSLRWRTPIYGAAGALAAGLAAVWWVVAGGGLFNDDPARLAAAQPWIVDWLVLAAGALLFVGLFIGVVSPRSPPWNIGLPRGAAAGLGVSGLVLAWLTLPPTIGQNVACRYAPLSTVLIGPHEGAQPVLLPPAERRLLPAFQLDACGGAPVALERVEPVTVIGRGATIEGYWLLPSGVELASSGSRTIPSGAQRVPPGDRIAPDAPRLLAVEVAGTGEGEYILGSLRLTYRNTQGGEFTFATQVAVCSGPCAATSSR